MHSFAIPFTSLSKLYKNARQKPIWWARLVYFDFSSSKVMFRVTYGALLGTSNRENQCINHLSYLVSINHLFSYLPTYRTYLLQNWLPKWNQILLSQLRFIPNWVVPGIRWMLLWWMLGHSGPNTVDVVKFEAGYSGKSANRAAKSPPLKNKNPNSKKV